MASVRLRLLPATDLNHSCLLNDDEGHKFFWIDIAATVWVSGVRTTETHTVLSVQVFSTVTDAWFSHASM
jgi:hypothetical protein